MKVYAFDVDDTLEGFNGPVKLQSLLELREQGHVVGIAGNIQAFMRGVSDWHNYTQFTVGFSLPLEWTGVNLKGFWLAAIKRSYQHAEEYVLVGNVLGVSGASDDEGYAKQASWRFVKESDFANGVR